MTSKRTLTCRRVCHLARRDERELVEQALRVLHNADDGLAALGPGVALPEVELGRQPGGKGDLVVPGRVVPGEQLKHRSAVGSVGILGPQLICLRRAGDGERLVGDDFHGADGVLDRGDVRLHRGEAGRRGLAGGRLAERCEVVGRSVPGVGRRRCIHRHRGAHHDCRHRHDDEEQDQELLPPLAPEEAPGPAEHGSAGWDTAAGRFGGRSGRPAVRERRRSLVRDDRRGPLPGSRAGASGRPFCRRAGRPRGRPTRPAGRRGSPRRRPGRGDRRRGSGA